MTIYTSIQPYFNLLEEEFLKSNPLALRQQLTGGFGQPIDTSQSKNENNRYSTDDKYENSQQLDARDKFKPGDSPVQSSDDERYSDDEF